MNLDPFYWHSLLLDQDAMTRTWAALVASALLVWLAFAHPQKNKFAATLAVLATAASLLTILSYEWSVVSAQYRPWLMLGAAVSLVLVSYLCLTFKARKTAILAVIGWVIAFSAALEWGGARQSLYDFWYQAWYVTAWVAALLPAIVVVLLIMSWRAASRDKRRNS